jgi:uroporphyrinogen decarboxylase
MDKIPPDFRRLEKVLLRTGEPDFLPLCELFVDSEIIRAVTGKSDSPGARVEFYSGLGFDYVYAAANFTYQMYTTRTEDTATLSKGQREFVDSHRGVIEIREDFNKYDWPEIDPSVSVHIQETEKILPQGMKILVDLAPGGILECILWLMGYVHFSYALYEDEQLVADMFEKIGTNIVRLAEQCFENSDVKKIGAFILGDDMGFSHGTMISPQLLRKYLFPWQRKLSDVIHDHGIPMILHSCGKLDAVMDDLIHFVKIDAKHSFEDKIMPVTEAKKRYGDRIAILGGVDVDFLCRSKEEQIRAYVDKIIDICAPGGGYALGTGNSFANYIPIENYLIMIDECRKRL